MTQSVADRSRLLWPIPGCKAGRICDRRIRASRFRRRRRSDRWDSIRRSTATRIGQQWFWTPSPRRSTEQPETESEFGRRLCIIMQRQRYARLSYGPSATAIINAGYSEVVSTRPRVPLPPIQPLSPLLLRQTDRAVDAPLRYHSIPFHNILRKFLLKLSSSKRKAIYHGTETGQAHLHQTIYRQRIEFRRYESN